jgi:predicted TPR repeat methyltransferase
MSDQPNEVTVEEALRYAINTHRAGKLDDAEKLYRRILEVAPEYVDALHFYGLLLHQRDRSDEGLALIERSIALEPGAGRYNNLGNALVERERFKDAIEAYGAAVELDPANLDAYNNLGSLHSSLKQFDSAEIAYQKAYESNSKDKRTLVNLGNLRSVLGLHQEAVEYFWAAVNLDPRDNKVRRMLGFAYYSNRQLESAAEVFRLWLETEPRNPIAEHMLAACSGQNIPTRGSDRYIEATFDDFAASFDTKLETLSYRAPQFMAAAVGKAFGAPAGDREILDAGCGTGLCGPLLAPYARTLIGVDLSTRMLDQARVRGGYTKLVKGELTAFIGGHANRFDVIVSADTLCYFGPLDQVCVAAAQALLPGGWLIFSVERAEPADVPAGHRIQPHGRYSHTRPYLERTLAAAGLTVASIDAEVLRTEGREPVNGFVVTAQKPAGH